MPLKALFLVVFTYAYSMFQTSFLQGLLDRNLRYVATLSKEQLSSFTINTVQVYGQEKYLMVRQWNRILIQGLV